MVVKSSRTPISAGPSLPILLLATLDLISIITAEATESLRLLTDLCPEFLKSIIIDKSEWLQMASSSAACPPSPSAKWDNEEEVRKRKTGQGSPIRVKSGVVTLRDVKERIRRELEA